MNRKKEDTFDWLVCFARNEEGEKMTTDMT